MSAKLLGSEGFRWFIAVVEDRDDPLKLGRVRVRIQNVHSDKKSYAPTNTLPWAPIMGPTTSASLEGIGISPTGIKLGTTVIGFFLDGNDSNFPIILGTLYGYSGTNQTNDLTPEAREINTINKIQEGNEPAPAYRSKYPFNKTIKTESGHLIEVDDTPDFERIHVYHKSGTYYEINQDGRLVVKTVDDEYTVNLKDKQLYVKGNVNIEVKGSYTLNVDGPIVINGSTVNINNGSKGAARIGDAVPDSELDGTQGIGEGSGTVFIGD